MVYKLLEHQSDMGVYGQGKSWDEAFSEGAKAMYHVMTDVDKVSAKDKREVKCQAESLDLLFVQWLNELVFLTDTQLMFFSKFDVSIKKTSDGLYQLEGDVYGEKIDLRKHESKVEVKAATYYGLKCDKTNNDYYCQCVLDI